MTMIDAPASKRTTAALGFALLVGAAALGVANVAAVAPVGGVQRPAAPGKAPIDIGETNGTIAGLPSGGKCVQVVSESSHASPRARGRRRCKANMQRDARPNIAEAM